MKHWNNNLEINPETIEILRHQNLATEQDSDGQSLLNQLSPKQHPQTPYQQPQQTGHIQKLSKQVMDISKALLGEREHAIQLECKTNQLEMERHNLEQKNKKLMELLYCMQLYRKGQNIEIKRLKSDQEVIKNQLHQEQREIIEGFCQKLSITMKQIETDDPAYWLKIQLDHIMVGCQKKEEYNVLEQIKVIFERETKSEMPICQLEQFKNHIQKVVHELIEQQQPIYQINYLNDLSISLSKCELQKLISKDYEQLSDTVNYFNRQSKQILSSFSKSIKEISQKSFGYLNTQNILSDYNSDLNNILQPNQLGIKQTEELQQLLQTIQSTTNQAIRIMSALQRSMEKKSKIQNISQMHQLQNQSL